MASPTEDRKKIVKKVVRWLEVVVNFFGPLLGANVILLTWSSENSPLSDQLVQRNSADIKVLFKFCVILSIISAVLFFLRRRFSKQEKED